MKALSVRQPWPYAIFHLGKDIENRNQSTKLRERIAIHASATMTELELQDARGFIFKYGTPGVLIPPKGQYDLGAIVGTVEIIDCVDQHDSPWFFGKYGFLLKDPVRLKIPIPCKGRLGFWEVPKDLTYNICERCGRTRDGHSRAMLMHETGACEQFIGEQES